ncbi:MAG TPA: bifunctional UDP-N-acetylglucosamine diphosphorylase/glucosamine-1-phosphate N-acetyltransferase GlmU [Actinomycetota bacterium]|nr:bifunctional UDP-N-acetylglucosamine diphosphorylase/glucosamine-1-phosphate N-acetyltransferase GlmU [Actinomycetota bacterium]
MSQTQARPADGRAARTAVVLAAGEGKRLKSALPKVLHRAAGRTLVGHVLAALRDMQPDQTVVVASNRRDEIAEGLGDDGAGVDFVIQDPPRGTGDALRVALAEVRARDGHVLVVPGDTPLLTAETLTELWQLHMSSAAAATLLTATASDPTGYGRIVRTEDGALAEIVEHRDATPEQLEIDEINAGVYIFELHGLSEMLDKIDRENSQGEYYLTDVIALLRKEERGVEALEADESEVAGVNSRSQLADVSALLYDRHNQRWLEEGVTIVDPAATYIDAMVTIEPDATIYPFTFLEGTTTVATGAEIGPQARIVDSEVGPGARVSFAVVRGSELGPETVVGPFASLRPGTKLAKGAELGTFVESKNTTLGEDSAAHHLSYLGDAEIGAGVNIGAGTITCNWDGQEKHRSVVDDDAYIGSDTMLVAPVHIGKRAATGAGSVVKGDVPDDALAVGVPARVIEGKGNKMKRPDRPDKPGPERGE